MDLFDIVYWGYKAYKVYDYFQSEDDNMTMTNVIGGVPISGPGVPEPPQALVAKQWVIQINRRHPQAESFYMYFFKLIDGRIMSYHPYNGWKIWRPKKNIVLSRNKTTLQQAIRSQSFLDKLWKKVAKNTKALKMATTRSK